MKNTFNNLDENEKKTILEQHKKAGDAHIKNLHKLKNTNSTISEDNLGGGGQRGGGSGQGTGSYKDKVSYDVTTPITLGKENFKTGTDNINPTSANYQKLKNLLLNLPSSKTKYDVSVIGSASTVGIDQGYDNEALALRRANNLVKLLNKDIPGISDKVNFKTTGQVVGQTNIPESPEALAAQKITVIFGQKNKKTTSVPVEVDNTAVSAGGFKSKDNVLYGGSQSKVCVKIDDKYLDDYKQMLRDFKAKHLLKTIPFSITKV